MALRRMRNADVLLMLDDFANASFVIRRSFCKLIHTVSIFRSFTTVSGQPGLGVNSADKRAFLKSLYRIKIVDLPKHLSL